MLLVTLGCIDFFAVQIVLELQNFTIFFQAYIYLWLDIVLAVVMSAKYSRLSTEDPERGYQVAFDFSSAHNFGLTSSASGQKYKSIFSYGDPDMRLKGHDVSLTVGECGSLLFIALLNYINWVLYIHGYKSTLLISQHLYFVVKKLVFQLDLSISREQTIYSGLGVLKLRVNFKTILLQIAE